MRWMWIDRVLEAVPGQRLTAVKSVSLAEEHLHDHFAQTPDLPALPIMPAPLIIEGMAQTAGILVGLTQDFAEKVALAKVSKATFHADATPGTTIRYTATLTSIDPRGASTNGHAELLDHAHPDRGYTPLADIDLMFSHLDNNMAGIDFPEHNFVFGDAFKTLLRTSGVPIPS